jgi:ferredoxin
VCIQFGRRAEYDLYRGSGRKLSASEAVEVAVEAAQSGLVPTVTNMSNMQALDFICFCCGCCCLVIDPASKVGAVDKILAPSRFTAKVDNDKCDGCKKCPMVCAVDAIEMKDLSGYAGGAHDGAGPAARVHPGDAPGPVVRAAQLNADAGRPDRVPSKLSIPPRMMRVDDAAHVSGGGTTTHQISFVRVENASG